MGEKLAESGMELGLWFTPMEFHPSSEAFQRNPQWACAPVGHATALVNLLDPDSGSNEAGIVTVTSCSANGTSGRACSQASRRCVR